MRITDVQEETCYISHYQEKKNNPEMMPEIEMTTMDTDRLSCGKSVLSPASTPSGHVTDG